MENSNSTGCTIYPIASMRAAIIFGAGFMAAVDEIIFHQLLRWHHFFDFSTPAVGLISDGLLHAAELIAIVAGFFLIADLLRKKHLSQRYAVAGFFLGMGGFQLFDGVVNHKILQLHQIRYDVDLFVYDATWISSGALLFLIGIVLWRRAKTAFRGA